MQSIGEIVRLDLRTIQWRCRIIFKMVGTKEHPRIFVPLSTRRQLDRTLILLALNCHHRSMLLTLDTWWTARPLMLLATTQCTELISRL